MRSRISIRVYVRPLVGLSLDPFVGPSHTSWISQKSNILTKMKQNSITNMKLFHLKDNSVTSSCADRQNASDVWTPSDLLFQSTILEIDIGTGEIGLYQKGPLVIKVWGAKSQKTLWGWYKAGGPSDWLQRSSCDCPGFLKWGCHTPHLGKNGKNGENDQFH